MAFPTPEHIAAARGAADRLKAETGAYVWPSVSLAQAEIESAGWTILSGANNGFGVKATAAQIAAGRARLVWTHETFNGAYVKVQQWFANFASLEDAYYAHAKLLATSPYYSAARRAADPKRFAEALTGVYATGIPGHPYGDALIAIMEAGDFYKYDSPPLAAPPVSAADLVQRVQVRINALRLPGEPLVFDGFVGPATEAAVARQQQSRGLRADGVIGPKTLAALETDAA